MNAFEPPVASRDPAVYAWLVVVASWGIGGATLGTAIGATLQLTQGMAWAGMSLGIGGMGLASMLGAVAMMIERSRSALRPELTDMRGTRSRPLHGVLLGVPVAVMIPSLVWLLIVASLSLASLVPAVTFGMLAVAVAWWGLRIWSNHQLARALEGLEEGRTGEARLALKSLAERVVVSRSARTAARLNLAMLALSDGDGVSALGWAHAPARSGAFAWAALARALAHLLNGDPPEEADAWLARAMSGPGSRAVQPEADAVRVLLVWRLEGEAAARRIGEELVGPGSTTLHRALVAALRERAGDRDGARAMRTEEVEGLLLGGMARAIPELRGPR